MEALKGLFESRKAIFSALLIIAGSILAIMKIMTVEQWIDYTKWLGSFYVAAEAVDSGLGKLGNVVKKTEPSLPTEEAKKTTEKITGKFKKTKKETE